MVCVLAYGVRAGCMRCMQVPNGAAGWYLLGRINRLTGRPGRAAEFYSRALQMDPMLWVAFTELCMLGKADVRSVKTH